MLEAFQKRRDCLYNLNRFNSTHLRYAHEIMRNKRGVHLAFAQGANWREKQDGKSLWATLVASHLSRKRSEASAKRCATSPYKQIKRQLIIMASALTMRTAMPVRCSRPVARPSLRSRRVVAMAAPQVGTLGQLLATRTLEQDSKSAWQVRKRMRSARSQLDTFGGGLGTANLLAAHRVVCLQTLACCKHPKTGLMPSQKRDYSDVAKQRGERLHASQMHRGKPHAGSSDMIATLRNGRSPILVTMLSIAVACSLLSLVANGRSMCTNSRPHSSSGLEDLELLAVLHAQCCLHSGGREGHQWSPRFDAW